MAREIGRIIKVNGKRYLIVSKVSHDNSDYLYLMTTDKPVETAIAKMLQLRPNIIEVAMVDDKKLKKELYEKFISSLD